MATIGPGSPAAVAGVDFATQTELDAAIADLPAVFNVAAYGATGDGSTDDYAAVVAAIQAAYDAGGGVVWFPAGTFRINSSVTIPNSGGSAPTQPTLILRGAGAVADGRWQGAGTPVSATTLDLRGSTGVAKLTTLGNGLLVLEDLTITDLGTSTLPYLQTTNTTLNVRRCAFYGNPSKSGATCDQTAVVLGGTSTTADGSTTDPFQGYGTIIEGNYFARIERGVLGQVYCNSVVIRDNTWSATCGGDAAIEIVGTTGFSWGNHISGNLFEVPHYTATILLTDSRYNAILGNGCWDGAGYGVRLVGSSGGNVIIGNYWGSIDTADQVSDAGSNTWVQIDAGGYRGTSTFGGGASKVTVRPVDATGSETAVLFAVKRSLLEATFPDYGVMSVNQVGGATFGNSSLTGAGVTVVNTAGSTTYDHNSIVKASGNFDLYAGNSSNSIINVARGVLKHRALTTASRPSASACGAGAVYYDTTVSKPVYSDGTTWRDASGTAV